MISPHEIPIGKIFWINTDIDGDGKKWQRARLQHDQHEDAMKIRYLDSDNGFEDYWNDGEFEDDADLSLTDPNPDNALELESLRRENAALKAKVAKLEERIEDLTARDNLSESIAFGKGM